MWVTVGVTVATTVASAAMSADAAGKSSAATQVQMAEQEKVNSAQRLANAASIQAGVDSANTQVETLERSKDIMKMQGKADRMIMSENHNQTAAMQVVMGAASGRVSGGGSLDAIYTKSTEDFMWDHMWNMNNEEITIAAASKDQVNILDAGSRTLLLGAQQSRVDAMSSEVGHQNISNQVQNQIDNIKTSAYQTVIKSVGAGIATKAGGANLNGKTTAQTKTGTLLGQGKSLGSPTSSVVPV